jgi:hypothetical protein
MTRTTHGGWRSGNTAAAWAVLRAAPAPATQQEVQQAVVGSMTQFSYALKYRDASTTTELYGAYLTDTLPPELQYPW